MKKYDLKRAVVTLLEVSKLGKQTDDVRHIKIYKDEIAKLPQPIDRKTDRLYLEYTQEIQRCRQRLKQMRTQRFYFKVFIKQYKEFSTVEWTFQNYELGPQYRREFQEMLKNVVNTAIKNVRHFNNNKNGPKAKVWFKNYNAMFLGNKKAKDRVFGKEGEVLRVYVEKNLNSLYEDKKPVEQRKYIGIELEFCAPIKETEFALKLFRSGIHKFAQLKKDGSLRPHDGETGYELAILLEETNYKKRLKQLIDLLTEVKAVAIDRRAGLHVHLDMRRRNKDLVYNNLVACQYALLSVVDPARVDNEFCKTVTSRKFPVEFTGERDERYKTINAAAFYKYKTLEVRMHEGSVDYKQISNWVDLLVRVANHPKKFKDDVHRITLLSKRVKLEKKLLSYLQDRSCYWQLNNNTGNLGLAQRIRQLEQFEQRQQRTFITTNIAAAFDNPIVPLIRREEIRPNEGQPEQPRAATMDLEEIRALLHRNDRENLTFGTTAANIDTNVDGVEVDEFNFTDDDEAVQF